MTTMAVHAGRSAAGAGAAPRGLVGRIVEALHRARVRRAAMRELSALDGRMLADLGIERTDIPQVVDAMLAGRDWRAAVGPDPIPAERACCDAGLTPNMI